VRNVLGTKRGRKTVQILAAIQIAAGEKDLARVFSRQRIEICNEIALRAERHNDLPQQQD